jgi:hypothetical protein
VNWTAVADSAFGNNEIRTIAYGNGRFVAVGNGGKMAWSTDGVNWTAVTSHPFGTGGIAGIAYGNGGNAVSKFIAVGDKGNMARSTDGVTWIAITSHPFGTDHDISRIAYGNDMFIAMSYRYGDCKTAWSR